MAEQITGGSIAAAKIVMNTHMSNQTNPHSVTADQVGAYTKSEVDNSVVTAKLQVKDYTDNSVATTKSQAKDYTDNSIAMLINSSPLALDTLYELANALGNDPAFSTTVLNEIGNIEEAITVHKKHMNPIVAAIIFGGG